MALHSDFCNEVDDLFQAFMVDVIAIEFRIKQSWVLSFRDRAVWKLAFN